MAGTFQLTSVPGDDSERETTLRERFEKWCETYNISYDGKEEWMKRSGIYKSNLQYIDSHNSLDLPYKLTDNMFEAMTHDEFNARFLINDEERESHFDSEPGPPVTAILEPEPELQQEVDDEAVESENSSLQRPAK